MGEEFDGIGLEFDGIDEEFDGMGSGFASFSFDSFDSFDWLVSSPAIPAVFPSASVSTWP